MEFKDSKKSAVAIKFSVLERTEEENLFRFLKTMIEKYGNETLDEINLEQKFTSEQNEFLC